MLQSAEAGQYAAAGRATSLAGNCACDPALCDTLAVVDGAICVPPRLSKHARRMAQRREPKFAVSVIAPSCESVQKTVALIVTYIACVA